MVSNIDLKDIEKLAEIVREETGNHVQEKNYSMLESRIRNHILKLNISDMKAYWVYFSQHEGEEREAIKSLMTTHYTFFFREYAHFETLDRWIELEIDRLKARFNSSREPVRVWSAAASRGQEVYSLAMFLEFALFRKHGIPYEITGTDIDPESIQYGKNGVYPIAEVNTIPHQYLSGMWKKGTGSVKDFAAVHPNLKARTHFEPLNLLEIPKWKNNHKFDVIFCRNVFIYFSEENVQKIALSLASRLDKKGLFVSGMSEPLRFPEWTLEVFGPSCYRPKEVQVVVNEALNKSGESWIAKKSAQTTEAKPTIPTPQEKYKVLCVDDSGTIQALLKKIFSQDPNCEKVESALNGREAREKLNKGKFDVITLDIHMPEVGGIEFLEKHYNKKNDPPVIMVSSVNRTDVELATKSLSLGAFDYVEKPAMNNLHKSAGEILTKVKMAIRSKGMAPDTAVGGFDSSIAQKIVVPDASMCLRVVFSGLKSEKLLEQVVRGQSNEYRSPAMLIVWANSESVTQLEANLLSWTDRQIVSVRDMQVSFKPNAIYIVNPNSYAATLTNTRFKNVSTQVLESGHYDGSIFKKFSSVQLLVDESISGQAKQFSLAFGVPLSDVTPSTSFPSLSVEYFANLRKSAA